MSDIVERLRGSPNTPCRNAACMQDPFGCSHEDHVIIDTLEEIMSEAADEIERLRVALGEIRDMDIFGVDDAYTMAFAARQALKQK